MQLRETATDGEPAFPKVPYNLSESIRICQKVFENVQEITTMQQLVQISHSRQSHKPSTKLFKLSSRFLELEPISIALIQNTIILLTV